jgi:hypothetical protein
MTPKTNDKQDWRRTAEFYMKAMFRAQAERDAIEEKRREDTAQAIDLLKDVMWQACGVGNWEEGKGGPICTKGLSAYEDACEYLAKRGHLRMYGRVTGRLLETKDKKMKPKTLRERGIMEIMQNIKLTDSK